MRTYVITYTCCVDGKIQKVKHHVQANRAAEATDKAREEFEIPPSWRVYSVRVAA